MSADNWITCPKCMKDFKEEIIVKRQRIEECYGNISRNEYNDMVAELQELIDTGLELTFAENYEIWTDLHGRFRVIYKSYCTYCGFKHVYDYEEQVI